MSIELAVSTIVNQEDDPPLEQEQEDRVLWNLVRDAIKDAIRAHGPITNNGNIGSAVKRVIRGIIHNKKFQESCPEDLYHKLVADSLKVYYEGELAHLRKKVNILEWELHKKKSELVTLPAKQEWIDRLRESVSNLSREKVSLRRELDAAQKELQKHQLDAKEKKKIKAQLTKKVAHKIWEGTGNPDELHNWFLAEKLVDMFFESLKSQGICP
jgi:predicted RNase H-like nuclease (RuvC/YqgF family)